MHRSILTMSLVLLCMSGGFGSSIVHASFARETNATRDDSAYLTVKIKPSEMQTLGAKWRLDGGPWQQSGTRIEVAPGNHEVTFKNVLGWSKPRPKQIDVKPGAELRLRGKYSAAPSISILLPGNIPLEMVWIPAGTFLMGMYPGEQDGLQYIESPQHQVTISKGFYMGKYEVTKEQWETVMGTTPWEGELYLNTDPSSPAFNMSWLEAQAFMTEIRKLTKRRFGLPTEAQWEYACRAGTTTRYHWGDDPAYSLINDYAWTYNNTGTEHYEHVVGLKLPNQWGLFDMNGNVFEMCQDWFSPIYPEDPVIDPTGPSTGHDKCSRGGSWNFRTWFCRSASRNGFNPDSGDEKQGFRVIMTK